LHEDVVDLIGLLLGGGDVLRADRRELHHLVARGEDLHQRRHQPFDRVGDVARDRLRAPVRGRHVLRHVAHVVVERGGAFVGELTRRHGRERVVALDRKQGLEIAGSHFGHFATIGAVSAGPRRCSRVIGRIAPTRRAQGNPPAPTPAGGSAASKRWSTRSFGEYAFLEDSRYASQAKNARRKNSHTVATVSSSGLGKSALSAAHPTHEVVEPRAGVHARERHAATGASRGYRCGSTNAGRPCPTRDPATSDGGPTRSFGEYAFL